MCIICLKELMMVSYKALYKTLLNRLSIIPFIETCSGFLFRIRPYETMDFFGGGGGAFLICSGVAVSGPIARLCLALAPETDQVKHVDASEEPAKDAH